MPAAFVGSLAASYPVLGLLSILSVIRFSHSKSANAGQGAGIPIPRRRSRSCSIAPISSPGRPGLKWNPWA
ncbi:hypothetical protein GCM10009526_00390 [Glutamicibacter creatinolyticus]